MPSEKPHVLIPATDFNDIPRLDGTRPQPVEQPIALDEKLPAGSVRPSNLVELYPNLAPGKRERSVSISFRIPLATDELIDDICNRGNLRRADLLRNIVAGAVAEILKLENR